MRCRWRCSTPRTVSRWTRAGVQAQTVISSTHQHPDGTMTAVLQRAAARDWPVYEWCYRDTLEPHGWLTQAQVDRKRAEVPEQTWLSEYDLQEAECRRAGDRFKGR